MKLGKIDLGIKVILVRLFLLDESVRDDLAPTVPTQS
jgi:hypothetical protein